MAVATPLSLNNIVNEFGMGVIVGATQTFDSGSGTVTAPSNADAVRIRIWGGGGGGGGGDTADFGGGGGGGGFVIKTMAVTGGSTQFTYSVGTGGAFGGYNLNGTSGTSSTITGGATLTAGGGTRGVRGAGGGDGGAGGTTSGGDAGSEAGAAGGSSGGNGGSAGGTSYGGGSGGLASAGTGDAPGGGGGGGLDDSGGAGAAGRVIFEWLQKALSAYTRGDGLIANHSANANIPTSANDLRISQFSGAEKNFTATVTSADISGTQNPPMTYATRGFNDVYGSINRSQVGINRNNTSSTNLLSVVETPGIYYDLLGNPSGYIFGVTASFSGDVRSSTLGYDFFSSISINGVNGGSIEFALQGYDGTKTTFVFLGGFSQGFGASGSSNSVEIVYGGP